MFGGGSGWGGAGSSQDRGRGSWHGGKGVAKGSGAGTARARGKMSGGGKGSGGGAPPTGRQADSLEHVVYSTFPMNKSGFHENGPLSFRVLKVEAEAAGCDGTLRDRKTKIRRNRAAVLSRCREVYQVLDAAKQIGADVSKAPSCSDFV